MSTVPEKRPSFPHDFAHRDKRWWLRRRRRSRWSVSPRLRRVAAPAWRALIYLAEIAFLAALAAAAAIYVHLVLLAWEQSADWPIKKGPAHIWSARGCATGAVYKIAGDS